MLSGREGDRHSQRNGAGMSAVRSSLARWQPQQPADAEDLRRMAVK
jgi:hypothetical protein